MRFIICHKHPVSGRLRFVRFATNSVCGLQPLPKLAVLTDSRERSLLLHPAAALREVAEYLALAPDLFLLPGDFRLCVEVAHHHAPDGLLPIFMAVLSTYQLPALPKGCAWIEMPDSFSQPYLERELLRQVYDYLMG